MSLKLDTYTRNGFIKGLIDPENQEIHLTTKKMLTSHKDVLALTKPQTTIVKPKFDN